MSQFGVGVNENVILKNIVQGDNLWIIITFDQLQEVVLSPFDIMGSEDVVDLPKTSLDIKLFNLKVPTAEDQKKNVRTQQQKIEMIVRDFNKLKAVAIHLASGYLTKDDRKFDYYRATGLDVDNFNTRILDQGVLNQIMKNIGTDLITMLTPFFGNEEYKFRLKLRRQSKDKHFATLPDSYLDENPFWESMDISKEASKVKFSDYEIKEGLNDPTPSSRSSADKPAENNEAPLDAGAVFGGS
jgi:hypothetical protein